jgi:dTDP-4-amino-4,6-dideoxygalactose transaminase
MAKTPIMTVPFNDLSLTPNQLTLLLDQVEQVCRSGRFILGSYTAAFEAEFAKYCGVDFAVGVGNGTDALELSLRACGVGAGDEVITQANAGYYSTTVCRQIGAIPVYCDISPSTLQIDIDSIPALASDRTKAVVVTHLYGQLNDVGQLHEWAVDSGIKIVEDCAQSHGATHEGQVAGSFSDVAAFSFYPTKNLGGIGDGGAVATSNEQVAENVRRLRQYGWSTRGISDLPGGRNSRLDEVQAAVLSLRLKDLDDRNARRRTIAATYRAELASSNVWIPEQIAGFDHVAHLFVICHDRRDELLRRLADQGIGTAVHYSLPDHLCPFGEPA